MPETNLVLYELAGADPALRFSPHCWKIRMALAHKGLEADCRPWRFTEKEAIAFSGQGRVPVLVDGDMVVSDSWDIACYLEERYPDRPSLFGGDEARALARFVNAWADTALVPAFSRLIVRDVHERLGDEDRHYFRTSREERFGATLEDVVADRASHLAALRQALTPLRHLLREQPFIAGGAPAYADYSAFGMFMWARCVSGLSCLEADDPVHHWRDRLLDAFDGLARRAPAIEV